MDTKIHRCKKRKAIVALAVLELLEDEKKWWKRGKIEEWMKRRQEQGYADNIVRELSVKDTASYREMLRMSHEDFLYILSLIERDIAPQEILGGYTTINARSRLTLAIRFIATGESFRSLTWQFRISTSMIS